MSDDGLTGEKVGEMVRVLLLRGIKEITTAVLSPDKEESKKFLDAEYAAMIEDHERDFE